MGICWPFKSVSLYVLKSHESFTYVSPDVFSRSYKLLIINALQDIVRVSFSAPNASQQCGAFLFFFGGGRMDNGIPALALYASNAYTEMFLQGRSLARISREMGLSMGLARDAYKKPDLKRLPVVRL